MKEFIDEISKKLGFKRKDLLEKEIIIQKILQNLSKDDFFSKNLAFKGGTCLIKCYLDYYRFSEDIDFTWIDQSIFKNKSQKEIRRILSKIIDNLGVLFVKIAKKRGLNFVLDKNNRDYIEFGGGNKTVTFKIWFDSKITKSRSFIKIQINFVEDVKFKISKKNVRSLFSSQEDKELAVLYDKEYADYTHPVTLFTYDIKEILCEKVRAILTRRGIKARDFVDIFFIFLEFKIKVEDFKDEIIDKTQFILKLYKKYRKNLEEKTRVIGSKEFFNWGDEKELLLVEINEKKFYRFVKDLTNRLKDILQEII